MGNPSSLKKMVTVPFHHSLVISVYFFLSFIIIFSALPEVQSSRGVSVRVPDVWCRVEELKSWTSTQAVFLPIIPVVQEQTYTSSHFSFLGCVYCSPAFCSVSVATICYSQNICVVDRSSRWCFVPLSHIYPTPNIIEMYVSGVWLWGFFFLHTLAHALFSPCLIIPLNRKGFNESGWFAVQFQFYILRQNQCHI